MDKTIVITIILIFLAGFLFWGFQTGFFAAVFNGSVDPAVIPSGIILFYGNGCPHCKIVDDFIAENKVEDKVKFTRLEVWYDKANQTILEQVAQKCNITEGTVGVPFLYDGTKCYVGDVDTISFFKAQAGIK